MASSAPRVLISYARDSPTVPAEFSRILTGLAERTRLAFECEGAQVQIRDAVTAPDPSESVERYDAVVIMGGADVDPVFYGQQPAPQVNGTNREVDRAEVALVLDAAASGVPVFGICRGMQVINVALGGTLVQHLGDDTPHRDAARPERFTTHPVSVQLGTGLRRAFDAPQLTVRSAHHQAVDAVAPSLRVSARSEDGVVEAVESPTVVGGPAPGTWALGVQWHPEAPGADEQQFSTLIRLVLAQADLRHHAV